MGLISIQKEVEMKDFRFFTIKKMLGPVVFLFLLLAIFFILYYIKPMFSVGGDKYYTGVVGSALAAIFSASLVWVAWGQLGNITRISSTDFFHRLTKDFFTPKTITLVSLIDCGALEFIDPENEEQPAYFEINQDNLDRTKLPDDLKQRLGRRKHYTAWEIDVDLLNHFEDIGMLEQRGIVDFQMVYEGFSWYLETVWKNDQIKKYIKSQRNGETEGSIDTVIFYQFQYIVTKCLEYETLHPGLCMWWWNFKRCFCAPKIDINI